MTSKEKAMQWILVTTNLIACRSRYSTVNFWYFTEIRNNLKDEIDNGK